ncbi:hypothetical protein DVH26_22215 [Paenibacillus sp. H1-7]|uniref:hypothetical protein n=1 Tax=Paenibacillus sp. H1-7 TaxID=2282849 RepID=UPI001EF8559A|nr:hypothetical protein [Paenibacillus sp. H1-7]ULL16915.1 hypothetical protein DVH26_22215 [Paenibacillus sp. H1-7]
MTVEIRVNGETAGHVPWKAADGVDLTSNLQPGANRLDIEVMGSPRNMFVPFHEAEGLRRAGAPSVKRAADTRRAMSFSRMDYSAR